MLMLMLMLMLKALRKIGRIQRHASRSACDSLISIVSKVRELGFTRGSHVTRARSRVNSICRSANLALRKKWKDSKTYQRLIHSFIL